MVVNFTVACRCWGVPVIVFAAILHHSIIVRAGGLKPHDYLRQQVAPSFNPTHTLPPLTRWSWPLSYEANVELAERWGYALDLNTSLSPSAIFDIQNNPGGYNARVVALVRSNPRKYPLSVYAYRPLIFGLANMPADLQAEFYVRDADGHQVIDPATGGVSWRTISPNAPEEIYRWAATEQAAPLAALRQIVPISIILSGGEDGLSVPGHSAQFWAQDPRVTAAKGSLDWQEYASERKAHYQQIISDATYAAAPDRDLFLYYPTNGAAHRGAFGEWQRWVFDYDDMRGVSDIANSSSYYNHANTGWSGSRDLLSLTLNSIAQQIARDDELSYNWVNGGFESVGHSDPERYMGYLKSAYNAGMIGGVAGYFSYPNGGFNADINGDAPKWLTQLEALSHVHATFSHLEEYLRSGHLVEGPTMHRFSTDLPGYELPTDDPSIRILARKLEGAREWLVTAWAAEGPERLATTELPGFGPIDLLARPAGTIYLIRDTTEGTSIRWIDPNAMLPSQGINTVSVTTNTGGILASSGSSLLFDGESFTANVSLAPNHTLTNVFVDGVPQGPLSSLQFDDLTESHTIHFAVSANRDSSWISEGDVDRDGDTDGRDFLLLQRNYGPVDALASLMASDADLDYNGVVNGFDFTVWLRQYGDVLTALSGGELSEAVAVPEPTGGLALLGAICYVISIRIHDRHC